MSAFGKSLPIQFDIGELENALQESGNEVEESDGYTSDSASDEEVEYNEQEEDNKALYLNMMDICGFSVQDLDLGESSTTSEEHNISRPHNEHQISTTNATTLLAIKDNMVISEEEYCLELSYLVTNYLPRIKKIRTWFSGNKYPEQFMVIEQLYFQTQDFLQHMKVIHDLDKLVALFLKYDELFDTYVQYIRLKSKADWFVTKNQNKILKISAKLKDRVPFEKRLSAPALRLSQYVAFLRQIEDLAEPSSKCQEDAIAATENIRDVILRSNDFMMKDLIIKSNIYLGKVGLFLKQDMFLVRQPREERKKKLMVFLFEKVIVFTKKTKSLFLFLFHFTMNNVSLEKTEDNSKVLCLTIKSIYERTQNREASMYKLEATSSSEKNIWVNVIEKCVRKNVETNA